MNTKRVQTAFLQAVIVLARLASLAVLIRLPLTEGRAAGLDLFSIYSDPFILYGYAASITFFAGLYKAFKLFGYIGQEKLLSTGSAGALQSIKRCAIALSIFIVAAGLYIRIFFNKEDDPAGFLAICLIAAFACVAVATAAALFEEVLRNAMNVKAGKDMPG